MIILDDIEPHEAMYSTEGIRKRTITLQDTVLPTSTLAVVCRFLRGWEPCNGGIDT
jgi:hypothetical protein